MQRTPMSSDEKKCRWKMRKVSILLTGSLIRLKSVRCWSSREVAAWWDRRWATKTYVHPHLEYCIQDYSPWLKKDTECLEEVQQRASKMVLGFRNLKYHERLSQLGLTTLKTRRLRGDLIETYKLLTNKQDIDSKQCFQLTEDTSYELRGNNKRIYKARSRAETRRNFFSQRVVDYWNNLPQDIIDADSVNSFKSSLDKFWQKKKQIRQRRRFSPINIKFKEWQQSNERCMGRSPFSHLSHFAPQSP